MKSAPEMLNREHDLKPGDPVIIKAGPAAGRTGIIASADNRTAVVICLFYGVYELSIKDLERVSNGGK